ncbi:MAG: c-type cytochrome [Desulfobacterales bacterium]|jgi:mono/diheme cytochrome c family protein
MNQKSTRKLLRWGALLCASAAVFLGPPVLHAHGWQAPEGAAARKNPVAADPASIQRGRTLYLENCAACHGRGAEGDGSMASALTTPPTDLVKVSGHHPDGDFFWKIETGKGAMPGFRERLAEEQIWDLVNYIQSLKPAQ